MFGRAAEWSHIADVLGRAAAGAAVSLVISGEPGMGKTTLLDAICDGQPPDVMLLRAAATEGEQDLPLMSVIDLFRPLRDAVDELEEPHRGVLARAVDHGVSAAPTALGLAALRLLDAVAQRHRLVVIAIDDAQWVDRLSAATIAFAVRRLPDRPIALIVTTRESDWSMSGVTDVLRLAPVDDETSRRILSRSGEVAAAVAERVNDACGGNPLLLEHVAASLTPAERRGTSDLPDPMLIAGPLPVVLATRLEELPPATCDALAVLAAAGSGDRTAVPVAWARLGAGADDIAAAERAAVVAADGLGYRFTHPLLRSAALARVDAARRRLVHRTLGETVVDIDRRAHHLDLAADGPDERAAAALEAAARRASNARSYDVAARAWERAARRSSTRADTARRLAEATRAYWNAGRPELGITLGREAGALSVDGDERVELVLALAEMTFFHEDSAAGVRIVLDEAESRADRALAQSATLFGMAANLIALTGDLARATRVSGRGVAHAEASGDPISTTVCEALHTHIGLVHGRSAPSPQRVSGLVDLVGRIGDDAPRELATLGQLVVFDLLTLGRWDDADALGRRVLNQAKRNGLANVEVFVHGLLGEVAWRRGRWIEARAESLIEHDFNETRPEPTGSFGHASLARVDAGTGRLAESRRNALLAIDHGRRTGMRVLEAWGLHALGLAALAERDAEAAVDALAPIWEICLTGDIGAPGPLWWQGDLAEALWRTGRSDDLQRLSDQLREDAARTDSRWAAAVADRSRGLLRRDAEDLRRSARSLDRVGAPFEAARSRALLAEIGARAEFADELSSAMSAFHRLGARPWIDHVNAITGATPPACDTLINSLSRAELRVALLVGRGHTNREVADELFVSPRTVDSHLQRIYRKLDLRSRTELALVVAEHLSWGDPEQAAAPHTPTVRRDASQSQRK